MESFSCSSWSIWKNFFWQKSETNRFFIIRIQKIMCKVQIYTQKASLFPVAPYILNNLVVKLRYNEKTSFNHKNLTPNQYNDTFWRLNELIVHNLHFRTGFHVKFMKIHKNHIYLKNSWNSPQIIDIYWKVNFFCTCMLKIVFKI